MQRTFKMMPNIACGNLTPIFAGPTRGFEYAAGHIYLPTRHYPRAAGDVMHQPLRWRLATTFSSTSTSALSPHPPACRYASKPSTIMFYARRWEPPRGLGCIFMHACSVCSHPSDGGALVCASMLIATVVQQLCNVFGHKCPAPPRQTSG
jgi:hypothetical protein